MLTTISPVAVARHLCAVQDVLQQCYRLANDVRAGRRTMDIGQALFIRHHVQLGAIETYRAAFLLSSIGAANDEPARGGPAAA